MRCGLRFNLLINTDAFAAGYLERYELKLCSHLID